MTRPSLAVDTTGAPDSAPPLASWYAEGASDGVGDRLLMFDNSGTPSLDLLRFRPEIAERPGFERGLRERVAELEAFVHPAFPCIRAIQHLDDGGLALVSTSTTGKRLGEIFRAPRAHAGAHPAFAAWLVRDLVGSLAELQRQGTGIAHTALTPERVVITPDGRLVITEHVLGAALDGLRYSIGELWRELGLIAASTTGGTSRLDARTDVVQLGWVVLSVLLGRRVSPIDHAGGAEALVEEFARRSAARSPALVPPLRRWLERALQLDDQAFESAMDAQAALYQLRLHGGPHAIVSGGRTAIEHLAFGPAPRLAAIPASPTPPTQPHAAPAAIPDEPDAAPRTLTESQNLETSTMAVATNFIDDAPQPDVRTFTRVESLVPAADTDGRRSRKSMFAWTAAAIFAAVTIVEAVVIARLMFVRAPIALPGVPVTVESANAGDTVVVDGREMGATPLVMTLTPDMRSIRVRSTAAPAVEPPAPIAAPPPADAATAAMLAQARAQRGGLRLSSPIELQVLEGERVLGSSADGPVVTTAGRHELDFINAAVGYRSRQVVDIKAGQILKMTITPPNGRVSINAVPWAQVSIDGSAAGDTPLANLPLAVGEHQITFRHPQLGEQTQKVVVKADGLTRVSAAFAR